MNIFDEPMINNPRANDLLAAANGDTREPGKVTFTSLLTFVQNNIAAAVASVAGVGGSSGVLTATDKEKLAGLPTPDQYALASLLGRRRQVDIAVEDPGNSTLVMTKNLGTAATVKSMWASLATGSVDLTLQAAGIDVTGMIDLTLAGGSDTGVIAAAADTILPSEGTLTLTIENASGDAAGLVVCVLIEY